MKDTKVKEIRQFITIEPVIITEEASLNEVIQLFIDNPVTRTIYVVDSKEDKLQGFITIHDILKRISIDFFSLSSFYSDSTFSGYKIASSLTDSSAGEFMNPEVNFVFDDDPIEKAFSLLFQNNVGEIPVVDKDEKLIGDLNIIELLVLWNQNH